MGAVQIHEHGSNKMILLRGLSIPLLLMGVLASTNQLDLGSIFSAVIVCAGIIGAAYVMRSDVSTLKKNWEGHVKAHETISNVLTRLETLQEENERRLNTLEQHHNNRPEWP